MDKKQESKRQLYRVIASVFLLFLLLIFVMNFVKKEKEYSQRENRMLTQRPKATASEVASGRFMKQFETYRSDQFALRDFWVSIKTTADLVTGKKDSAGVFRGKEGYLLEDIKVPNEEFLQKNIQAIKDFQIINEKIPVSMMLIPNAANILEEKMPAFAVTADQEEQIEEVKKSISKDIQWIDVSNELTKIKKEAIYYKTDHHWTTYGAYQVFLRAAPALGFEPTIKMKTHVVSTSFNGTLAATSGYRLGEKEQLCIYLPEEDVKVVVNYVEEQRKTASMYDSAKLKERDKYSVFFGGNYPLVTIKTTAASNQRILIFKDSYANCFVPFLTPYYREIIMVDPRYYYGDILSLMKDNNINQVLFLYSANTFFEDNSISGVLTNE